MWGIFFMFFRPEDHIWIPEMSWMIWTTVKPLLAMGDYSSVQIHLSLP